MLVSCYTIKHTEAQKILTSNQDNVNLRHNMLFKKKENVFEKYAEEGNLFR